MINVLIYVEDPGAANFIIGLPLALENEGYNIIVFADARVRTFLKNRSVIAERVSLTAEEYLSIYNPQLVIVGTSHNPDSIGFQFITCAKTKGIVTLSFIDARANVSYRFRGRTDDPLYYAPDWLVVQDEWTKESFIELGYSKQHIIVCNHPHYDYVREAIKGWDNNKAKEIRNKLGFCCQADQPVIVFIAEPYGAYKPEDELINPYYSLKGRGTRSNYIDIVIEEFLDAILTLELKPFLVLRLHPRSKIEDFAKYSQEFELINNQGTSIEVLYSADIAVGMTSMPLVEAAIIGKPTLSILPLEKDKELLPTIKLGLTKCATTRESIRRSLQEIIENYDDYREKREEGELSVASHASFLDVIRNLLQQRF